MIRFLFVCLCSTLLPNISSFSQSHDFRAGYIVSLNNDTILGDIDFDSLSYNYFRCIFKDTVSQEIVTYNPNEIKAYAIFSTKYFESKTIRFGNGEKTLFLSKLFHGVIDVYFIDYDSILPNYFLEKKGVLYNLKFENTLSPSYRKVLVHLMSDDDILHDKIYSVGFDQYSIVEIIKSYHLLVANKYKNVKYKYTPVQLPEYFELILKPSIESINEKFKPGYIVGLKNDTTRGLVFLSKYCNNSVYCFFERKPKSPIRYLPEQLKSFAIPNTKYFVSKAIPSHNKKEPNKTVFLEFLVHGIIDLYYHCGENYFVEKNGKIYELSNNVIEFNDNGNKYTTNSNKYKSTLLYLMKDAPSLKEQIENLEFNHKSLTEIIIKYHELTCDRFKYIDYYKSNLPTGK